MLYAYKKFTNMSRDACLGYKPGHLLCLTWIGTVEADDPSSAAETLFARHNRDDRPDGAVCPSMSVGDVVVLREARDDDGNLVRDAETHALACADFGFEACAEPAADTIITEWWPEAFDRLRRTEDA